MIHFTLASAIAQELPSLLTGKPPSSPSSSLGTANWAAPPQALLLGGAYQDEDIDRLEQLIESIEGAAKIPWLRVDVGNKPPPQLQDPEQVREYGLSVASRMKMKLGELSADGKLGHGNGNIYLV